MVVDAYLGSARPVASSEIAERPEVGWGASTVRAELAMLEAAGYLTHPHTSAGRVPTDAGYRRYVDALVESGAPEAEGGGRAGALAVAARGRRGDAGDDDGAGQVTDLMALATAPPLGGHPLHARRRAAALRRPLRRPAADRRLMTALEGRADVLGMLRSALEERSVFCWIGDENPQPELRSVSVVGANYGLGHRNLGSVGVVGPLRMDYATAIASVQGAARELSRYFETVYGD